MSNYSYVDYAIHQTLYTVIVYEWIIMINLIQVQKSQKIEEITFKLNNDNSTAFKHELILANVLRAWVCVVIPVTVIVSAVL